MIWNTMSILLALLWVISTVSKYRKTLNGLRYKKGIRTFFRLQSAGLSMSLPSIPYISLGSDWGCRLKHEVFSSRGNEDVINFISCFPSIQPGLLVADPLTIKVLNFFLRKFYSRDLISVQEIFSDRIKFPKYQEIYDKLKVFGKNIVVAEGDEWKRHRKAIAPSLSEKNNRMVWEEAVKAMSGLMEKWGKDKSCITIEHIPEITVQLALRVISAAGFGRSISWNEDDHEIPPGHKFPFHEALHIFLKRLPYKVITREWMSLLSSTVRETHDSFRDLQLYTKEMVHERKQLKDTGLGVPRHDLFNAILATSDANEEDEQDVASDRFTNEDVFANMFVFLLAGHETVAHTLSFVLGLLAIYQDEQETLYKHIIEKLAGKEVPVYDQMNSFSYVLATFYEAMRLFPPALIIPKQSAEDTSLPMQKGDGSIEHIPVAKHSCLLINVIAMHHNPKYWPEPEKFDPSRFMGEWNKDAYIPFSGGMRSCIGRRFAEVEAVALLVMIIKHYQVELKDPEQYAGLNKMEIRAKLLEYITLVTSAPLHEPLVFKKRSHA